MSNIRCDGVKSFKVKTKQGLNSPVVKGEKELFSVTPPGRPEGNIESVQFGPFLV
jgi:hypothetical protein